MEHEVLSRETHRDVNGRLVKRIVYTDGVVESVMNECTERGCVLRADHDVLRNMTIFQHNDNPEHVLIVPDDVMADRPYWESKQCLEEWTARIHAYEEGRENPLQDAISDLRF